MSRWSKMTDTARGHDYDKRWQRLADAGESIHGEADLVERLLGGCPGHSVLDAGCGTGRVAIELARRGADVVGVDLDAAMLAAARDKAPHLRWVHGDVCHVDLAAGPNDERNTTARSGGRPAGPEGETPVPESSIAVAEKSGKEDGAAEDAAAGAAGPQQTIGSRDVVSSRGFDVVVMAGNVVIFLAPGTEPRALVNLAGMLRRGGLLVAGFQLGPGRVGIDLYDRWAEAAGLELVHRWSTWDREPFAAADPASGYAVSVHARRDRRATLA